MISDDPMDLDFRHDSAQPSDEWEECVQREVGLESYGQGQIILQTVTQLPVEHVAREKKEKLLHGM